MSEGTEEYLSNFLDSHYEHVKGISKKSYHLQEKFVSPGYIIMFVPIKRVFTQAIQKDKELFNFAWERNIVFVSPSTLLAILRPVSSLWKQEKQNKNALEILVRPAHSMINLRVRPKT